MTRTRLPSDHQMAAWRLAGRLICQCLSPIPVIIGAFAARECSQCAKPILHRHQAEELIANVLREVAP